MISAASTASERLVQESAAKVREPFVDFAREGASYQSNTRLAEPSRRVRVFGLISSDSRMESSGIQRGLSGHFSAIGLWLLST